MNRLHTLFKNHYYLLTAILMFLSFPSYDFILFKIFPVVAWFSLIPLFYYISGKSIKEIFFVSFITGLLGNFFCYGWIGDFGIKVAGGNIVILLFLIPSLTVFFVIKIIIAEYLSRKYLKFKFIIYPSVWIIIDYVQSIGFLAFPWTYIGYSQYTFTPFIQVASVTGILGINFIMIMFNKTLAEFFLSSEFFLSIKDNVSMKNILKNRYFVQTVSVVMLVVLITVSGSIRLLVNSSGEGKRLKVGFVQSCVSPWDNWSQNKYKYLYELLIYTKKAILEQPDLIIWSESATLEYISYRFMRGEKDNFDELLLNFAKANNIWLLTGEIGITADRQPQNNAVLINGTDGVVSTYSKINLVPFGEWFPYEKWFPPVKRLVKEFGGSSFVPGKSPVVFNMDELKFGTLICYEGIFFQLCRKYRNLGADFLVNITNDGWTDNYNGHYQHYSSSIFRAVENGIWLLRCGNTGVTAVINPKGEIINTLPILKKNYMIGEIDTSQNVKTIYSIFGDIILYIAMLFIASLFLLHIFNLKPIFFVRREYKTN
ncbi:MAG: apolipoprotein N-acyltransferase [Leptospirales bacterium]|nr:apolipoprotein N-acyltransferase [Leptospirales bacterium]